MDVLTKEQRRKNMQSIKSKDSKIELVFRKALWAKGYRYRKNYKKLIGCPDVVILKYKIAIFCDGEFWHGYNLAKYKQSNGENKKFWVNKIESNIKRDKYVNEQLQCSGWKVLRFWEHEIKNDVNMCISKIEYTLKQ